MPLTVEQLASAAIRTDETHPVLALAAEELRLHLGRIAASPISAFELTVTAGARATDGFVVSVEADRVSIEGESGRGALNGAYWLLEQVGLLWVRPGTAGERFVSGHSLAEGIYRESPRFGRRTLILGNDALHDDWREWLEFASRNRLNSVFFHDTPPSVIDRHGAIRPATAEAIATEGKGWMFERWDSDGQAILSEAARRGIAVQFGGHHLPGLLRRAHFDDHPDWFPLRDGQRDARYNLCTSSAGAVAEVRARAREFFRRFGGASVYHLWADDITGGGWCACAECERFSASDQALRATNVLAEELERIQPGAVIAHLAYHDTIAAPTAFAPAGNVTALYAPRNRNYAYAIDDPQCVRNAEGHFAELLALGGTFRGRRGALAAFEYYSDAILYKWMDPPNLQVLPADAVAYARAGVFDFGNLAVTPRPWVGPTWHAWWFARCAWTADMNAEADLARFCEASFDEDGPRMAGLYRSLESVYRKILDLGELERIPRHDVLDFSDTPRAALALKARQIREAAEEVNAAVGSLPIAPAGLGPELRADVSVQLAMINHLAERISAWDAALDGRSAETREHLGMARLHLSAVADWDQARAAPAFANLSQGMLRAANWHTNRIERLFEN